MKMRRHNAFTLIELSIVLVIIGLIIGGILVGQDLIKAAEVRAQLSQIEKYNSAVNTFRGEYGGLPGDLALATANQFGFNVLGCTGLEASRDGNGQIAGWTGAQLTQRMETLLFWQDLSSLTAGGLIEGFFPNGGATGAGCINTVSLTSTLGTTYLGDYIPSGKMGSGNFVYVYAISGYNWYGISAVTSTDSNAKPISAAAFTVTQSYKIDAKMDDGLPLSGNVQATYLNNSAFNTVPAPNATTDSAITCYNTSTNIYSLSSYTNYGANGNCALSFRFQ